MADQSLDMAIFETLIPMMHGAGVGMKTGVARDLMQIADQADRMLARTGQNPFGDEVKKPLEKIRERATQLCELAMASLDAEQAKEKTP